MTGWDRGSLLASSFPIVLHSFTKYQGQYVGIIGNVVVLVLLVQRARARGVAVSAKSVG